MTDGATRQKDKNRRREQENKAERRKLMEMQLSGGDK